VRRGAGVGGSDRVTLVWPDPGRIASSAAAVLNHWLEVTVKANPRTGLTQPDVFYFGNLVGETGDGVTPASTELEVGAPDLAGTRRTLAAPAPVTSAYDHNRDGAVNALDMAVVRRNLRQRLTLKPSPVGLPSNPNTGPVVFATAAGAGAELREPDTDEDATALLKT
jgi:hypothetical protein